jgi:hypothetical protein
MAHHAAKTALSPDPGLPQVVEGFFIVPRKDSAAWASSIVLLIVIVLLLGLA